MFTPTLTVCVEVVVRTTVVAGVLGVDTYVTAGRVVYVVTGGAVTYVTVGRVVYVVTGGRGGG